MPENWIEAGIWLKGEARLKDVVLGIAKPITDRLIGKSWVKSFHYFFEPEPDLVFRLEVTSQRYGDAARELIKGALDEDPYEIIEKFDPDRCYEGEVKEYEDGWDIAKKVFEQGSRMAISKFDPEFKGGEKFQEGKLIHCFLNSLGYTAMQKEDDFHLNAFIGRVLIQKGKQVIDPEIQKEIKGKVEKALRQLKNKRITTI